MRNHAHAVVACDFFTVVTARFHVLYVFVALEVGTRRILHWNVTAHPTAAWTIQQFRAFSTPETSHRFVLHDRDSIFAASRRPGDRVDGTTRAQDAGADAASQRVL